MLVPVRASPTSSVVRATLFFFFYSRYSWKIGVVGKMGDAAPTPAEGELAIHYLIPEGCVHVFGAGGVPTSAILREEAVPPSGRTASTSFLTGFRDWRICCPCSSFLNHHFSPGEAPLWPLWFGRGVS